MHRTEGLAAVFGLCLVLSSSVGIAMGAGATSVAVQPSSDTITAGNTSTVDIVVESAAGGVGSIDIELSVSDGAIADISDTAVAGNPDTVETSDGTDSVRITATGMDTADSGSVPVASVTLTGDTAGTSSLDLTVAAIGDESGEAYSITDERDGELTVEGVADSTPTETATESDSPGSDDDDSTDGSGTSDESSSSSDSETDDTPTPTATPTPDPTDTATEQTTTTQTPSPTSTATPAVTSTPTRTSSGDTVERGGSSDTLFIIGGGVVALLGGVVLYRQM